jgi:hypothetical protein
MNASDFRDLVAGMDPAWLCDYLQIHSRTLKRWKSGAAAVPHSAVLALRLKLEGDVASFAGEAWKGFFFGRDGKLYIPFFHRGHEPAQICAMFFQVQELHHLRREVQRLGAELKQHQANAWAMQKVNEVLRTTRSIDHGNTYRNNSRDSGNPARG